jgi:hypothetical protein
MEISQIAESCGTGHSVSIGWNEARGAGGFAHVIAFGIRWFDHGHSQVTAGDCKDTLFSERARY